MNIVIRTDSATPVADLSWILSGLRERGIRVSEDAAGNLVATLTASPPAARERLPAERIRAAIGSARRTWPPRRTGAGAA